MLKLTEGLVRILYSEIQFGLVKGVPPIKVQSKLGFAILVSFRAKYRALTSVSYR